MERVGWISTGVLLFLGSVVPLFAQQEEVKPPKQEEKAKPEKQQEPHQDQNKQHRQPRKKTTDSRHSKRVNFGLDITALRGRRERGISDGDCYGAVWRESAKK
jgi:hypothetical protein